MGLCCRVDAQGGWEGSPRQRDWAQGCAVVRWEVTVAWAQPASRAAEKETDTISRKQVKCMGVVSAAKEGKEERTEHLLCAHAGSSAEIPAPLGGQFGSIQLSDGHRHVQGHQVL